MLDHFKAEMLINILGKKVNNILMHINADHIVNYEEVKNAVLREYEPTLQACLENFHKAERKPSETYLHISSLHYD